MAFVVRFRDYRPSSRDALPWTQALIQQAAVTADTAEPGSWTDIETKTIPSYPDPTNPPYMNFETELATLAPGWYRVIFKDATGDQEITAPRMFRSGATYRPSTKSVAVHVKNRTVDANNNYKGDFDNTTVVTRNEVEEIISLAEERVVRRFDVDPNVSIPTESQAAVTGLVALYSAMLIELTKFSEQVARGSSPYPHLKDLFDEQMKEVREDILGPGTGGDGGGAGSGTAHFTFPDDIGGMIRWDTQF